MPQIGCRPFFLRAGPCSGRISRMRNLFTGGEMKRILLAALCALLIIGAHGAVAASPIPQKFHGQWQIIIKTENWNPWWADYKYPVTLEISDEKRAFTDQAGNHCAPELIFYDEAIDELIFIHCLPTKHGISFRPFYRFKSVDGQLIGHVWTYKALFGLQGASVDAK